DVAGADKLLAQLAEVVDLPVEDQCNARVRVAHRLVRPFRVDDGQPPVSEKNMMSGASAAEVGHAMPVRSAVGHRLQHRGERVFRGCAVGLRYPPGNSTHVSLD